MPSYKERILMTLTEAVEGLTTVEVARRAGISKTTVIRYLSELKAEGMCEFVEVGPSKLWRAKASIQAGIPILKAEEKRADESLSLQVPELFGDLPEDATIFLSFEVKPSQICALLKEKGCKNDRS